MAYEDGRAGSFQRGKDGRWHEYHGVGEVQPDGSCEFDDDTESGLHSHAIHAVPDERGNSRIRRHRHEGAFYQGDFCDDRDCDDRFGSYGRGAGSGGGHYANTPYWRLGGGGGC